MNTIITTIPTQWTNAAHTSLDVTISHPDIGNIPYTITTQESDMWTYAQTLIGNGQITPTEFVDRFALHNFKASITHELAATDLVALRYFKAGISFPPDWVAYVQQLRTLLASTVVTTLPQRPAYDANT